MIVPAEVAAMLEGTPQVGAQEQAFPFVTVDPDGFPHAALLSRMELEVGPGRADVRAALRSRRTRAHLEERGRAALIAVRDRTAHYVKLRLLRATAVHDLLACVFEVVEHKPDSLGVALTPITYPVSAEIARAERWDTIVEALAALAETGASSPIIAVRWTLVQKGGGVSRSTGSTSPAGDDGGGSGPHRVTVSRGCGRGGTTVPGRRRRSVGEDPHRGPVDVADWERRDRRHPSAPRRSVPGHRRPAYPGEA